MLGLRLALGAIALMAVLTASMGGLAIVDFEGSDKKPTLELTLGGEGAYWEAMANGARAAANRRHAALVVGENLSEDCQATLAILGSSESASCGGDQIPSEHLFHVGIANYAAGRICAHYAARHSKAGGTIVALVDDPDYSTCRARLQGFRDTLRYFEDDGGAQSNRHVEVVTIAGDGSEQQAGDLAATAKQYPDAAVVIDFTGGSADALQKSFARGPSSSQPRLVSFDHSEAALAAIETGELAAVVTHDPYICGFQAVDRLVMYHRSDLLGRPAAGRGCIHVPAQLVERGTLAEFRSALKTAVSNGP